MRALVVTSMYPSERFPARGGFVRDQVEALRRMPGVEVAVFAFEPGNPTRYLKAAADLRRRYDGWQFDVVHAHFGLTAWPALALRGAPHVVTLHGTDLAHPRSRAITLAALRFIDLAAPVSESLAGELPPGAVRGALEVLPCGVNLNRFRPIPRRQARLELGLPERERLLLFASDPARREKRYDRAAAVAGDVPLLSLTGVAPEKVPLLVNAADAVLVTSEREGFGLAVLEALACDVPVLATPVGIAPEALQGIPGTLCESFEPDRWRAGLASILAQEDPHIQGRARADRYSAERMAERVLAAWRRLA